MKVAHFLAFIVCLFLGASIQGANVLSAAFISPQENQMITELNLDIGIDWVYPVTSVVFEVGAFQKTLAFDPASSRLTTNLPLPDLPLGPQTLLLRVRDNRGNVAEASRNVIFNDAPRLLIHSPMPWDVGLPEVDINIEATDQSGPVRLSANFRSGFVDQTLTGINTIRGTVSVAQGAGLLTVDAFDEHNARVTYQYLLYGISNRNLRRVFRVPGRILDAKGDRAVVQMRDDYRAGTFSDHVYVTNRAGTVSYRSSQFSFASDGLVTPFGAIFVGQVRDVPGSSPQPSHRNLKKKLERIVWPRHTAGDEK